MGKGFTGAILTVMGVKSHIATTTGKTVINDRMVTIHFYSETLLNTEGEVPGDWLRLWFPHESRPGKLYQRAYTLTNVDADADTFDLAFVLHEPLGPASAWATRCEAEDSLEVMRYPGIPFAIPDPAPRGFLFLGDLTSYPAICSILETLDGEIPATAYLIAHDPLDYTFDFPRASTSPRSGFPTNNPSLITSLTRITPIFIPGSARNPPKPVRPRSICRPTPACPRRT